MIHLLQRACKPTKNIVYSRGYDPAVLSRDTAKSKYLNSDVLKEDHDSVIIELDVNLPSSTQ